MSLSTLAALDETLCASDLPFKVDIVDWAPTDKTSDGSFGKMACRYGDLGRNACQPNRKTADSDASVPPIRT